MNTWGKVFMTMKISLSTGSLCVILCGWLNYICAAEITLPDGQRTAAGDKSPFSRPFARVRLAELELGRASQAGESCERICAGHHGDCGIDGLAACR